MVDTCGKFIGYVRNRTQELFMEPFVCPTSYAWPVRIVYPTEPYERQLPHGASLHYQPGDTPDTQGSVVLRIADMELVMDGNRQILPGARKAARLWNMQMIKGLDDENVDALEELRYRMVREMYGGASEFFGGLRQAWIGACEQASEQHIRYTAPFIDFVESLPLAKWFQDVPVLANLVNTSAYARSEVNFHYHLMLERQEQLLNHRNEIGTPSGYRHIEHTARDVLRYMVWLAAMRIALKAGYDVRFDEVVVRINNVLVRIHEVVSTQERHLIVKPGMTMQTAVSELFPHPIKNTCYVRPLARGNLRYIASIMNHLPNLTPEVSMMMGDRVMLLEYDIDLNDSPI
ncbi:hypothetical protein HRbin16_01700 [bacterium HR16]|nr:hypothetical protein HRbin16_01700 [bacterium HR16]